MYEVTTEDGWRFFSEHDIKEQAAIYYQNLYTPRTSPTYNHSWTNLNEQQITIYGKNKQHEKEFYIREITMQEVKKATKTLKNSNSIWPELIKNEFIKYGDNKRLEKLAHFFSKVFNHEQIPQSWLSSMIINIDKGKKNKELLSSKRGISLSNNIFQLFERVINNRIKRTLQFTEAQAGAKKNRTAVDQLFTLKAIIQNRTSKGLSTYTAFIDLENVFDKTWLKRVFFDLWNRGIKDKIWRIMLKLKQNRKTTVPTKFGETKEIDTVDDIGQGNGLRGPEASVLVDEIEVELKAAGFTLNYGYLAIASVLFMDDITLVSKTYIEK